MKHHVFPNNEVHSPIAVFTAQQSTMGQNPVSPPAHHSEPLRKTFLPTAIKVFASSFVIWWVLLGKVPCGSTSVFSALAVGKCNLSHLPRLLPAEISPKIINAIWMMHIKVIPVTPCDIFLRHSTSFGARTQSSLHLYVLPHMGPCQEEFL